MPREKTKINLLPREDFEKTTLGRIMKWALSSFRFIVIVVEFVVISGFMFRFWLDVQISDLDDEITQKSALISSKSSFEREFRDTQKKLEIYKELTSNVNKPSIALDEVAKAVPRDTKLVSFSKDNNVLKINGSTLNEASISTFIANLEKNSNFTSVDLTSITTQEDSPLIDFALQLSINTI